MPVAKPLHVNRRSDVLRRRNLGSVAVPAIRASIPETCANVALILALLGDIDGVVDTGR